MKRLAAYAILAPFYLVAALMSPLIVSLMWALLQVTHDPARWSELYREWWEMVLP